jgi:hypothetical protein
MQVSGQFQTLDAIYMYMDEANLGRLKCSNIKLGRKENMKPWHEEHLSCTASFQQRVS